MQTAEKIERTTLRNLIHNEDYTRKVLPFLKSEYFQDRSERVIFSEIQTSASSLYVFMTFANDCLADKIFPEP